MPLEGPQIRYAREEIPPPVMEHSSGGHLEHALKLAREIEDVLEFAKVTLSPRQAYSVRIVQAVSGSLVDQLTELVRSNAA